MRIFKINKDNSVVCESLGTRNGFKHAAKLIRNGRDIDEVKICYLNRTWERYTYESVLQKLVNQTSFLTDSEKKRALKKINSFN